MIKKIESKTKNKGFTLIETLLYISITSILILSISSFVLFMMSIEKDAESRWLIERESRKIITVFEDLVNNSTGINSPTFGNSSNEVIFDGLVLNKIILNNTDLEIDRGGDLEKINSENIRITNFNITNYSNDLIPEIIRVEFTLESEGRNNEIFSENFITSFTLRDYAN